MRAVVRRLPELRVLPPRVAWFHARALALAVRAGDAFALQSATRPADVALILRLARGRRRVVELGTATGWTTAALLLADPQRRVESYDPVVQANRDRYLGLLPAKARARARLVQAPGAEGAAEAQDGVELLFVDSTHERAGTVAEVEAWRPRLATGALVVLHDYENPAFPGVHEAVVDLGLAGDVHGGCFVWQVPADR